MTLRSGGTASPQRQTARLVLRPVNAGDIEELHQIWIAPGVRRFLFDGQVLEWSQASRMIEQSCNLYEREGTGLWLARHRTDKEAIGFAGFWYFREPPELELLYGVAETYWGQGYATEAATAVLRYGVEVLGIRRIVASADAGNRASIRVMEKLGMRIVRRAVVDGRDTVFAAYTAAAPPEPGNP
ncbi:hypothetical protein HRbin30_00334 [bacterium HR30]|nr:hypothetical protein HRbin30_00334 [bacterium HR30]